MGGGLDFGGKKEGKGERRGDEGFCFVLFLLSSFFVADWIGNYRVMYS